MTHLLELEDCKGSTFLFINIGLLTSTTSEGVTFRLCAKNTACLVYGQNLYTLMNIHHTEPKLCS